MKRLFLSLLIFCFGTALANQNEPVTVTYIASTGGPAFELMRQYAQDYQAEHPNVTIEVLAGPESATERLALYLQYFEARSPDADILEIDVIWPGDLAEHLSDLYQFEGYREAAQQHFPAIIENNTVDGKLVGIPLNTDAGLLYYRTDLLEKYGFGGPPQTWTEFEEMARTIQQGERENNPDFWGFVFQGNPYESFTCNILEWIASNGGGEIVNPEGVITLDNPQAQEIVARAGSWVGDIAPIAVTSMTEEPARRFFQAGNAAFMRNWPYAYILGNADDSAIQGAFEVTTLPAGDCEDCSPAATLGGWQLGVSKYSDNPEIAADVALYLSNYEHQLERALEASLLPTLSAVYEDANLASSDVGWFGDLLPVLENAVARPSSASAPNYPEVSRVLYTEVHNVLTGASSAEEAVVLSALEIADITGFPLQE